MYKDKSNLEKFNLSVILQYDLTPVVSLIVKLVVMFIVGMMLMSILLSIYYRKYKTMILDPIAKTVASINYIRKKGELKEVFEENDINALQSQITPYFIFNTLNSIIIQEEVKDKKVLKLIIQPVIENSIIHGLSVKDYKGIIENK